MSGFLGASPVANDVAYYTVKPKPRFWECYTCFGYEDKTRVERILVIFQDQPYHSKGLAESFPLMWLNIGLF